MTHSCLQVTVTPIGGISLNVSKIDTPLTVSARDVLKNQHLSVACSVVCNAINVNTPKYTEVEYIESTGTQYIDTGIVLTETTDYEVVGEITEKTQTGWIAGTPTWIGVHKKESTVAITQTSTGMKYMSVDVNEVFKIGVHGDKAYFNDVETNTLARKKSTLSLFLFAYHHTNGTGSINSSVRIHSFKIWDNDILVRDFIPVIDEERVPCMYDKVTQTFFYNKGTDNFLYGREIHPVEYLESTGTQYIDTQFIPKVKPRVVVAYQLENNLDKDIVGFHNATQPYFIIDICENYANSNTLFYKYGKTQQSFVISEKQTYQKHTIDFGSTLNIDGVEKLSNITGDFSTNTRSILMFKARQTPGASVKIFSCSFYENGTLVRDYVPAIDENGIGFMFDRVTHAIFDNKGTGSFITGNIIR